MSGGIVAAGHTVTAQAAESMLREGGNAFDAALAGMAAACVAEPVLASLGGGGFMLAVPANDPPRLYDFFVQTPIAKRPEDDIDFRPVLADFGAAQQEFHIGHGTVAVPGAVKGLFGAYRDLATLPLRELVAPAVALARDGVEITAFQAYLFDVVETIFASTPAMRRIFASPGDSSRLVQTGDRLRNPELADALEVLAIEGETLFYRGEIAQALARDLAVGGHLTAADLDAYEVALRHPLAVTYRKARLLTNPAPSSGGLLIAFALELLDAHDVADLGFGSARHLAVVAAAMQATGRARIEEGLTDETLLSPDLVESYRTRVAGRLAAMNGTTQLSVIDAAGNLASVTLSNGEGSGYVIPGTGIVMNNMLGEEDLNPGGFHRWPQSHRMTSMMAPSALRLADGTAVATGSGGSNRIRSAVLQVLMNLVDFGLDAEDAVDAARIHVEGDFLSVEGGFDVERLSALLDAWPEHQIWPARNMFFGGAHTVMAGPRGMLGAGDARRGGVCIRA